MTAPLLGIDILPLRRNGPRGIVKAFIVYDDTSVVLIDTGFSAEDGELILAALGERVSDQTASTAIVLTHSHGDHTGGLARVRERYDWPIAAHRDEVEALCAGGVNPTITLSGGERWQEGGGLRFVPMPGHTAGSIGVFHEPSGAFIAGDSIVSAGQHLMISPAFLCDDPQAARDSVARLLDSGLEIQAVLVAHGEDVLHDAHAPLTRILATSRVSTGR